MYEIFSVRTKQDLTRTNHQRRNIGEKGGGILKSKSNNVLKKKKVFADINNIMRQKNEDEMLTKDDHQRLKQSVCDKKNNNLEENDLSRDRHQRVLEKIMDENQVLTSSYRTVPNDADTPYLFSENTIFDESSNSTIGENSRIEEDVFFGTYYSISEDERELISAAEWDTSIPESISGYCSEGGSCDENFEDRWMEKPLWKTGEHHQIVGVPETSKCETLTKLEDMEFTSLFSEMPCVVKATLDVPELLFSSDCESDATKIPVPDLEW